MAHRVEAFVVDVIERKRRLRHLFVLPSLLFRLGVFLRHCAYDWGLLREKKLDAIVISIGNLVAGGTGKTPFLMRLGRDFEKFAILTRGYRGKKRKGAVNLREAELKPDESGDEAALYRKAFPDQDIIVGRDRQSGALLTKAPLILLDDGMQHRKLRRDFEIVMLNRHDLFGHGHFLPRGYLRDHPKRLSHADYLIVHHVNTEDEFEAAKRDLRPYSQAPVLGTRIRVPEGFGGVRVAFFAGIGSPTSFRKTLTTAGAEIVDEMILPDHIAPTDLELEQFIERARQKGAQRILCTEKDWVKLGTQMPITPIPGELEVVFGDYQALIKRVHEALD